MDKQQRLTELLVEFAHTLTEDFSAEEILDHLTQRILGVLPVDGAGVMLMNEDGELHFLSASDEVLQQIEPLQIELDEGPCLEAYRTGHQILITDLATDQRFPQFGPRAVEAGMGAVFSFPMRMEGGRLGAADLYRKVAGDLADDDAQIGQVLADVAAAYVTNARARDVFGREAHEMRYQAMHDPLTGLPNRTLLNDRIEHALSIREHEPMTVLFIDLDDFKLVNDQHGHEVGDRLLVEIAHRLLGTLRVGDTLARIGGDEFIVACDTLDYPEQVDTVVRRVEESFAAPFTLGDVHVSMSASIGVAIEAEGDSQSDLLSAADDAMYQAKQREGTTHHPDASPDASAVGDDVEAVIQ